jgi:hypothetical protein
VPDPSVQPPEGQQPVPINPGADGTSRAVFSLIFNGLSQALNEEQWMPLSERMRVASVIYEVLRAGGVEIRLTGLDRLRQVASEIARDIAREINT